MILISIICLIGIEMWISSFWFCFWPS